MSSSIVLTTLNARYQHSAFGLRYLYANLKEYQTQSQILEFTISQNSRDIAEQLLRVNPKIIGMGVYIWNTRQSLELVSILKRLRPEIIIVLGGPEVSYETEQQEIAQLADFVIQGEADFLFYEFCKNYLGHGVLPSTRWIRGELPEVTQIQSPYPYYRDEDIRNRVIYVEASRGCPYRCEYCLSSLDKSVRSFHLDSFLAEIDQLIQRGARSFKFVDRTFNLSISFSTKILQFFLDRIDLGLFLHFEMVPDRLAEPLKELIQKFPAGSLQFEIGIQTWSPEVAKNVSRRQDYQKIRENFEFLTQSTGVHLHADLIVGLPGETLDSFATGFDAVSDLNPHEIQVGILKRLKGTPIIRHDQHWQMVYQSHPPFQVLQTKSMSFEVIQQMGRFAQFWDLYANSGNFTELVKFLKARSIHGEQASFFWEFYRFSQFLTERHPQGNGIALLNLLHSAWIYLTEELAVSLEHAREILIQDYTGKVKRDLPQYLRSSETHSPRSQVKVRLSSELAPLGRLPKRQSLHHAKLN